MDAGTWVMLGIGLLLTVGTGFFVAAEFALVNLDRHDLESRAAKGEGGLGPTIRGLKITSTHLSSAQLGITLTTLLTGYTLEPAISTLLRPALEAAGLPEAALRAVGATIGIVVATVFSMIVGELVPKNFAIAVPRHTAKVVMPFQTLFTTVFKPVVVLLNNTANGLIRSLGVEPQEELSGARSAEELSYLIRHSAGAGAIEEDDATLLHRTLRFTGHDAAEMMTPRVRMTSIPVRSTAADLVALSVSSGYSRFPVVASGPDDIVGVVSVKRAFALSPEERDDVPVRELMLDPVTVPGSMRADALLAMLRDEGLPLVVVSDEYGGTDGIVTLEDLVEEMVGEVEDEHDRVRSSVVHRAGRAHFDATLRPDELGDRAGIVVPEGDWDTVAGFVLSELGRVAVVGDVVPLDEGELRVERVDGPTIVRLSHGVSTPAGDARG